MKRSELAFYGSLEFEAFQTSGESSVAAWCAKEDIPVQSMYQWLRKSHTQSTQFTQWLSVVLQETVSLETVPVTIKLNGVVIECPPAFESATLTKILQVVQNHVH